MITGIHEGLEGLKEIEFSDVKLISTEMFAEAPKFILQTSESHN